MDPSPLTQLQEPRTLSEPVMIATFVRRNGFNSTARAALDAFAGRHSPAPYAEMDCDPFFDFTITPPTVRQEDGERVIDWPRNQLQLLSPEHSSSDVIVLPGIEPHLRWPTFAKAIRGFAEKTGLRRILVLRTWPAQVPHTRPTMMRLTTTSDVLPELLGIAPRRSRYEGPTDFGGALMQELASIGIEGAGLTAFVPNYLGVVPNPIAMVAMIQAFDRFAGTTSDVSEIELTAQELIGRANEAMEDSDELRRAVLQMEEQYEELVADAGSTEDNAELPPTEELLGDVERFLRGEQ